MTVGTRAPSPKTRVQGCRRRWQESAVSSLRRLFIYVVETFALWALRRQIRRYAKYHPSFVSF